MDPSSGAAWWSVPSRSEAAPGPNGPTGGKVNLSMKPLVGVLKDSGLFRNYGITGAEIEERELCDFSVTLVDGQPCKSMEDLIALIAWDKPSIDRAMIDALASCRLIVRNGVGVDNVDLTYAGLKGVEVRNVKDYGTEDVALHSLSLILHAYRRLSLGNDRIILKRQWDSSHLRETHEPAKFRIGIVGFGRIGQRVADLLAGLGFRISFFDPYVTYSVYPRVDMVQIADCDLVSIHCALSGDTEGLIGDAFFRRVQRPIMIVNTSRGKIIDFQALRKADSKLAFLGTDVLPLEPPFNDRRLFSYLKQLVREGRALLSPHCAFYNLESIARMRIMSCEIVKNYFSEKESPAGRAAV